MGATTANKALIQPTVGGDVDSWGSENNSTIGYLDTITGGWTTKNCAGMADVTLTAAECQHLGIKPSGVLTGNIFLLFPQPGFYGVYNNCTGAYSLTAANSTGGAGVVCAQAAITFFLSDGTDCWNPAAAAAPASTYWCGISTGSANQQLLTPVSASLSALTAGDQFTCIAGFTNTSSMQIGVSGTGGFQTALKRTTAGTMPMTGGEVFLGNAYDWLWDGSDFQLMNEA